MARVASEDGGWLGLANRTGVVTGAGGGIGLEIAVQLLAAGARVALLDRDAQRLAEIAGGLGEHPGRVLPITCDVTDPHSVQAAADQVQKAWGAVDLLVNNAAALYADALMDIAVDKWNQLLSVNLTGYLLCAQAFGRQMIAHGGGSMVHIASISASIPQPYSGAYSVSKAGVKMLSQLLAVELGAHGVRSNVVSPAMIRTPMSEGIYTDPAVRLRREQIVPAGRISTPSDIAGAVLFLSSERASYISGQEFLVDGGLTQAWLGLIPRPGFEKKDTAAQPAA
ncbi:MULTISPECIES: SDR family NAD(P)-dependent oxidoreductase [unclassified Acidovorax]|uniref:SDR family NAD(P)-dependent oxidoreductase n=1 Tax=unclassified Acidovorax TaxID=2684926 RepID=UPI001C48C18C|nr:MULTISPECIES: SDR family oxidoreductase [unclassified Acidovorax]MBV7430364.1 SDR family oxidoreductase [Acidovorax sp. sif0732]MBV7451757.1 SDR family oxidoreductase [Acidovorax sp. sif0715]